MSNVHRGADALVETLAQAGVKKIFTLSGNHIMTVFDACLDRGIELVHTRHEAAAVHMADAWARLTGEVGVAMVTGGPGHANAVAALYTAQMSESPVLLLSGTRRSASWVAAASRRCAGRHGRAGHQGVLDLRRGERGGERHPRAMRLALAGRPGPVHLSLPSDALEGVPQAGADAAAGHGEPAPLPLEAEAATAVLDFLAGASRPLILAGPASLTAHGRRAISALEEHTGMAVVAMESPRGVNDPSLGAFAQVLAQADRILLLGKRLDFTLKFGRPPALAGDCRFMQVDPDDEEIQRSRRALGARLVLAARADTATAIERLCAQPACSRPDAWRQEVRAALAARMAPQGRAPAGTLHPSEVCSPLQQILDSHPRSVLVCDGGEFGQWAQACLQAPNRVINGPAGAIGCALPMAVAARMAVPDAPVIALMGDGTTGFHVAEFDTAVRYGAPLLVVVGNDARWNAEYQIQMRTYGKDRTIGCELLPTRYDQVCAAFGGHGEFVQSADEMLPAARRALASGLPACINVAMQGVAAPGTPAKPGGSPRP